MLDLKSYEEIWKKGISRLLDNYQSSIHVKLNKSKEELKSLIWNNYSDFNSQCKQYMSQGVEKLDRHKVSACYILAILKSQPFVVEEDADDEINVTNEQFAISVGLSILRSFIVSGNGRSDNKKTEEDLKLDRKIFDKGFCFPDSDEVAHGSYRNNFAIELYFSRKEECYNILSLSHSLYLLEVYNRLHWKLQNTAK